MDNTISPLEIEQRARLSNILLKLQSGETRTLQEACDIYEITPETFRVYLRKYTDITKQFTDILVSGATEAFVLVEDAKAKLLRSIVARVDSENLEPEEEIALYNFLEARSEKISGLLNISKQSKEGDAAQDYLSKFRAKSVKKVTVEFNQEEPLPDQPLILDAD